VSETAERRLAVAPNSMYARIFLAFLASAGLFYVNIMPAIVDGLKEGLAFTDKQAGFVASANVYGAAVGALLVVFVVRRLSWRPTSYALLAALILMDLLSLVLRSPEILIAARFIHGFVGGALVGVGFSVIARMLHPDRTFGVLLFVQFGLGGLGNLYIPRLVPVFGTEVLFFSLIAFSVATAAMVPFLGDYKVSAVEGRRAKRAEPIPLLPIALVLAALFLFQSSNNGLFAFIIGLGRFSGLDLDFITVTLAASGWIGLLGAGLVVVLYTRFGRTLPLASAMLVTITATWALHFSSNASVFLVANCIIGITWAFVMFGIRRDRADGGARRLRIEDGARERTARRRTAARGQQLRAAYQPGLRRPRAEHAGKPGPGETQGPAHRSRGTARHGDHRKTGLVLMANLDLRAPGGLR
jgi:predicted MFS family arabinose efflux permease